MSCCDEMYQEGYNEAVRLWRPQVERLTAENERLLAALGSCQSWIERWTKHVGNCNGGAECTCGRSAVLFDASDALDQQQAVNSEE